MQKNINETKSIKDTTKIVSFQEVENFDIFFDKFQKDSIFQKDRIIFPLKYFTYDTKTDSFSEEFINKKEWKYFDFSKLPENYLRKIIKISDDEFKYNIQIEDTGVYVDYIFKIHNGKWYLVEVNDKST
jgi:hypothetical protein